MHSVYRLMLLITISLVIISGCSNSGAMVDPPGDALLLQPSNRQGERALWGYYSGYADMDKNEFSISPMRAAETHYNLVSILNTTAGVQAEVLWDQSNKSQKLYKVRVTIKHPYPGNPYFAGFDVRGILITGASYQIGPGLWTAGGGHPRLVNADGFTRWWNPSEFSDPGIYGYTNGALGSPTPQVFDSQLNGYKVFADALPSETEPDLLFMYAPALDAPNGRGVFTSAQLSRVYEIQFPLGKTYFNYAVDASWAAPAGTPPVVPGGYPLAANCPEAWHIKVDQTESTLEYFSETGITQGSLVVNINVYDWQGRFKGLIYPEVIAVRLYSNDLFGSNILPVPILYDDGFKAVYKVNLSGAAHPHSAGTAKIGVEVISAEGTYKQGWEAAPPMAVAAYQIFDVQVAQGHVAADQVKNFGIHAYVLRKSNGSSPAISPNRLQDIMDYTNSFWNQYGFGFVLAQTSYIDSSELYNLDADYAYYMFLQHHDYGGLISVYFVNSFIGDSGLAFTSVDCHFEGMKATETFICYDSSAC